jgi:hypothetical protein
MNVKLIALCSDDQTEHSSTLLKEKAEFLNVKHGGPHNNHWALNVVIPYSSEGYNYVVVIL